MPVLLVPVPHDQVPVTGMAGSDNLAGLHWVLPEPDDPPYPIVLTVLAHSVSLLIVPLYHVHSLSAPVYLVIFLFARPRLLDEAKINADHESTNDKKVICQIYRSAASLSLNIISELTHVAS